MKNYSFFYILLILFVLLFLFIINNWNTNKKEFFSNNVNNKYCCIYAYYEKDNLYKSNFQYFLENGLLNNVDYYIVINGYHTINIPKRNNITILIRENKGYDFGAYSYVIKKLNKNYDYYIFLNATVKGPYLDNKNNWLEIFLSLFNANVKLVGSSICYTNINNKLKDIIVDKDNIYFVQTPFFIIKHDFLMYLNNLDFFNEDELNNITDLEYVIFNKEIKLSYLCYKFGGNINCYLEKYRNLDYRKLNYDINNSSFNGDPYFINSYFCNTIQPNDVIFYKNKRFLYDTVLLKDELEKHRLDVINKVCMQ
jgi:hypothetical protein